VPSAGPLLSPAPAIVLSLHPPESVSRLVLRAKQGDRAAFAELVETLLRPAYLVALSILGRTADAEDVAQESLLVALERLEECREEARFSGWLFAIVRNRALNLRDRRHYRDVTRDGELPDPPSESTAHDELVLRDQLLESLSQLPEVQRQIILLFDLEGWTHAEIAASLGVSELMSRQHLFLARRALRAILKDGPARVVLKETHDG